ncbi:CHAT domain-containing protein [Jidongwangia harbinensis]|uniref:CHAT domain-containing protein n=1 Tax=Jidongwangia harbinensis TaxID=2878561 RepID=UPI001CDA447C|nr:CHAT domain-containing protein [Jidongwangia harbinensis]MCA2216904.1 CHAT domain-containing protein [Jidongwangia harbinensis]
MGSSQYRSELDRKRRQRVEAEEKAGKARIKETERRTAAASARAAAGRSKSSTTVASKLREAERFEREAAAAGKDANTWQKRAAQYAKDELKAQINLANAERSEAAADERRRAREAQQAARRDAAEKAATRQRLEATEALISGALRRMPAPKAERLRVLILGAASSGDLRIGREQKRIRAAVESALHRELIVLDVRPAATTGDLLDGITKFRPHVVHFSGHTDDDLIEFEDDVDDQHEGVVVTARAFARAVAATDSPPLLVLLNSCNSARQIGGLVERVAPFAIGMADEIDDGDAITYAAQFYAAVANGQSIQSAHLSAQAALELAGLSGSELPMLAHAPDADPATTILVKPATEV